MGNTPCGKVHEGPRQLQPPCETHRDPHAGDLWGGALGAGLHLLLHKAGRPASIAVRIQNHSTGQLTQNARLPGRGNMFVEFRRPESRRHDWGGGGGWPLRASYVFILRVVGNCARDFSMRGLTTSLELWLAASQFGASNALELGASSIHTGHLETQQSLLSSSYLLAYVQALQGAPGSAWHCAGLPMVWLCACAWGTGWSLSSLRWVSPCFLALLVALSCVFRMLCLLFMILPAIMTCEGGCGKCWLNSLAVLCLRIIPGTLSFHREGIQ